ncbi:hypothetical protein [Paraflavitalea speifideaquila]|uniref:hypothetical protein n=1 Tax=Paraflavitalea speifideaquila TaxID=3076558 RepID=UPI0028E58146|nr:hypothetical protein [Paraflavitalea speifideiaquila]
MEGERNLVCCNFWNGTAIGIGGVIISFVFLHQRKKYRHKQEVMQIQETFTQEMLHSKAEIQEQTLQHIATELHDNFTPTLSVININLASVAPLTEDPVREKLRTPRHWSNN